MIRKLLTLILLALTFALAGCVSLSARLQRSVGKTHSASYSSANFELRYRPGTVPESELARLATLLEGKLARISALLEIDSTGRYTFFSSKTPTR